MTQAPRAAVQLEPLLCRQCDKKLCMLRQAPGMVLSLKCPRCRTVNTLQVS
jgi:phage FluMu protein Com